MLPWTNPKIFTISQTENDYYEVISKQVKIEYFYFFLYKMNVIFFWFFLNYVYDDITLFLSSTYISLMRLTKGISQNCTSSLGTNILFNKLVFCPKAGFK